MNERIQPPLTPNRLIPREIAIEVIEIYARWHVRNEEPGQPRQKGLLRESLMSLGYSPQTVYQTMRRWRVSDGNDGKKFGKTVKDQISKARTELSENQESVDMVVYDADNI